MDPVFSIGIVLLAFMHSACSQQESCVDDGGCAYFQCLVRRSERLCGVDTALQGSPARQAFYFCTKIQGAEMEFDAEASQALRQLVECSVGKLHTRVFSSPGLCSADLAGTIANALGLCLSEAIGPTTSNCQNIRALSKSIFSSEILNLEYGRLYSAQVWNSFTPLLNADHIITRCSGLDRHFLTLVNSELKGCAANIDSEVVILLDSSNSIGQVTFNKMLRFATMFVARLPLHIRVGAVSYSNRAVTISSVVGSHLRRNLSSLIERTKYVGGRTSTDVAIRRAVSLLSLNDDQSCNRVQRNILILSDGKSNSRFSSVGAAEMAKKQHNVHVYYLAVGKDVNERELTMLVSRPLTDYKFRIQNFEDNHNVQFVLSELLLSFCNAPFVVSFLHCAPLMLSLGGNQSVSFHLHTLPTDFTLQVTGNGTVDVHFSFTERNPNAITKDFTMEGGSYPLQYFVGNNDKPDLFLTVISGSKAASVEIGREFYDTTSVELLIGPSSVLIGYNSSTNLYCSAKSSGQLTFIWYQTNYGIAKIERFSSASGDENVTDSLVLNNVIANATFWCAVKSDGHTVTSKEARISVPYVPSPISESSRNELSGVGVRNKAPVPNVKIFTYMLPVFVYNLL